MSTEEGSKPSSEGASKFLSLVDRLFKLANSEYEGETDLFERLLKLARGEYAWEIGKRLWKLLTTTPELVQEDRIEQPSVVSGALTNMQRGSAPRIAITGMTSAGKSTLVNALFGKSLIEVSATPDTTSRVIRVEFPSGLVIYDTPGTLSDEEYENLSRLFLRLPPDSDLKEVTHIPFQSDASNPSIFDYLSPQELPRIAPIDLVLWVVDLFRTPTRDEKKALKVFFHELESVYGDHLIVAGTKYDLLKSGPDKERERILQLWGEVCRGQMVPVSATTGERLSNLVEALFQAASDSVSLAKLQEALVASRKLNRRAFVITETSKLLADIPLLTGKQQNEIRIISITIFALICTHYSVDEQTWLTYNGNAFKIGDKVRETGVSYGSVQRDPQGAWEGFLSWFGKEYHTTVVEYGKLGIQGLEQMLPWVYKTIRDFDGSVTFTLSEMQIQQKIEEAKGNIQSLIAKEERGKLAAELNKLLSSWLS